MKLETKLAKAMAEENLSKRKDMLQSICFSSLATCPIWNTAMSEIDRLNELKIKSLSQIHAETIPSSYV